MKKRKDSTQSSSSAPGNSIGVTCIEMTGLTEDHPEPAPSRETGNGATVTFVTNNMMYDDEEDEGSSSSDNEEEEEEEDDADEEEAERQPLHQRSADVSNNNGTSKKNGKKKRRRRRKGKKVNQNIGQDHGSDSNIKQSVSKSVHLNDHRNPIPGSGAGDCRNGCTGTSPAAAAATVMHGNENLHPSAHRHHHHHHASTGDRLTAVSPVSPVDKRTSSILLKRGDTRLSLDQSGLQRLLPSFMQYAFADQEAESIYQQYYDNEKRSDFTVLIHILLMTSGMLLILFAYYCLSPDGAVSQLQSSTLVTDEEQSSSSLLHAEDDYVSPVSRYISLGSLVVSLAIVLGAGLLSSSPAAAKRSSTASSNTSTTGSCIDPKIIWSTMTIIMWCVQVIHTTTYLWLFPISRSGGDALSLILVYTFMIYVIFPLRLRYCVSFAVLLNAIHLSLVISSPVEQEFFLNQIVSTMILMGTVNCMGLMAFFFYEKQQRRAFLETCQSLESKLVLEEESLKQERLLLSVLPQHVANDIRRDLGSVIQGQFKKIYMSRHENVSILFADIVGFTAISSTCPAAELVRTLNELFARFDKLADKYHQLRIKILGDCYYCISGAPVERSDHAVLCVHMGLSMVQAIKSVREQTKKPVDMRVGIHTGGILAGVMGQKQWQFDVYSKDVELANKMESGGLPGMVHISEKTFSFLNGEFEVKDGDGASREEAIRLAGIKTYLIVSTIKQWPEGTLDALLSPRADSIPQSVPAAAASFDPPDEEDSVIGASGEIINVEEYNRRLLHELLNRESESSVRHKTRSISMRFVDEDSERQWMNTPDVTSCLSLVSLPLTLASCFLSYLMTGPECQLVPISILMLSNSILLVMALLSCASSISASIPKPIASVSKAIIRKSWIRLVVVFVMISIWITGHIIANLWCSGTGDDESEDCFLPPYLVHGATIGLIAFSVLTGITYIMKMLAVIFLLVAQSVLNFTHLKSKFISYDMRMYGKSLIIGHEFVLSLVLLTSGIVFFWLNRLSELVSRRLFLWKKEVQEQKDRVGDMRVKNEALVYNILPPHVAIHFLGKRKKDEELYSKSYNCVGVLFAAMPNFSDFYTEESVNNQGLECLRFLNEVISDYDALLEQERFKGVIKIKTISSTYMAASGLSEEEDTPCHHHQWSHLARLTEFALALKEQLSNINKESFNNFVLRIGLNQGPITAGVIGARKPHYDIWGNTVNVASRMESTGKAGSIQVVQETKDILEELGYKFDQRGLVSVKGKGMLMTFYLIAGPNDK